MMHERKTAKRVFRHEIRTDQKGILSPALFDTACPGSGFFRLHEFAGMVAGAVRHGIHALVLSCLRVAACSHGHMAGLRQTGAPGQPVVASRLALVLLLFVDRPCIHVRSNFLNALFARFPFLLHKPSLRSVLSDARGALSCPEAPCA